MRTILSMLIAAFIMASAPAFAGDKMSTSWYYEGEKTYTLVVNSWGTDSGDCDVIAYEYSFEGAQTSSRMTIAEAEKATFTRYGEDRQFICMDGTLSFIHLRHAAD